MFVKFERTNLRAKSEGPVWINPDNVCTVEGGPNEADGPIMLLLIKDKLQVFIRSKDSNVYVLGNVRMYKNFR